MREVVEEILDGIYDYEKGALDFSCTKIEIELQKGEVYEGSFTIYATEGKYTLGYITASDPRMECLSTEIRGNLEEVAFRFHGEWMDEGEVTKGEFQIVSNKGEYYLPYVVSVVHTVPQSSMGPIKDLVHFVSLAKNNWREAVCVFYTAAFAQMVEEKAPQLYLLYKGLSFQEGNEQHVEEFLVAANKKQRIEYLVTEKRIVLERPSGIVEQVINIFRNGWGYTRIEVWCEGEFLFVEKNVITEDDFWGNRFALPIYVDDSLLHGGKNIGRIILRSVGTEIEIPITILKRREEVSEVSSLQADRKKNISRLVKSFQDYRLKKISKTDWIMDTTKIIDRMVSKDERDLVTRLFQAHLLLTKEQMNEAGWILEHVGELLDDAESPALEAYYLYLNTLYRKEAGYTGEMSWQVTKIYREYGEDWKVAWLLLFLVDEYNRNPASKWNFLERQYENGCTSPLIYLEALVLLNNNPMLLRKIGRFEIQVLNYGRKREMISSELLEQALYLAERVKEFNSLLYVFFVDSYRQKKDVRLLKEICTLLIKGNRTDKDAFEWFAKGVEDGLRITNLYEYYMLSMDLNKEIDIPKSVLLYFTYQTNLDYLHNAYLFYYVAKKERVYGEIFANYCPRIEKFVEEQIGKGHINSHLAFLYKKFLNSAMINERTAENLSRLLFANEIRLEQKDIRNVIVCRKNHEKEQIYPVSGNKVWIPLYGKDSCILFENQRGMRLAGDVPYTMEKLMSPGTLLDKVAAYTEDNPEMDIYLYEKDSAKIEISDEDVRRWYRLTEYEYLSRAMRTEVQLQILRYYHNRDEKKDLVGYLESLDGSNMSAIQRGGIVRHLVLCDCYEKAYEWLVTYGNCKVDDKILLHLLEMQMGRMNYSSDGKLVLLCYQLLKKEQYSEDILQYMMIHYKGLTRELRNIWKTSKAYSMDRKVFCERMLIQMMFSGYYVGEQSDIFKEYVLSNGDEQIVDAYLTRHCYEYFVYDKLIQHDVLVEIGRLHSEGHSLPEMCQLAYLKYYAENKEEILKEDIFIIRDFVDGMLEKDIHMKCILELRQYSSTPMQLMDKAIVEYRSTMDMQPKIHYLIMRENGEVGEYQTEPMEHVLGGVFIKEFVLFFGESLQYYIVEDKSGEGKLTQSGTRQKEELLGEDLPGRYGMINDIVISKSMQDYDTFDDLLTEYYKRDFYNQELFKLRK